MRGGHWRKSTNARKRSQYRNYDAGYGPMLRISNGLIDSSKIFKLIFLFDLRWNSWTSI
jgi:hypothetical protein